MFQTPSAGRWVLQPGTVSTSFRCTDAGFKPHQRGGGCCSDKNCCEDYANVDLFQTPSAGRWVLQPVTTKATLSALLACFKPHQRGGGCCSFAAELAEWESCDEFQTPSAGRWVLQLENKLVTVRGNSWFQTPSAGRWVLQRAPDELLQGLITLVSNPISGEVGAAARAVQGRGRSGSVRFQTPSAGRWVLQREECRLARRRLW